MKRKVVVSVPSTVVDLGGNGVLNAGVVAFEPEVLVFDPALLPPGGETFTDSAHEDTLRSGAEWGGGALRPGVGGGAGFLGDLVVDVGEAVMLCTTAECNSTPDAVNTFEGLDLIPLGADDVVPGTVPSIEITDGVFPFSSVTVRTGGGLSAVGGLPLRLFARGELVIDGLVDVAGSPAGGRRRRSGWAARSPLRPP